MLLALDIGNSRIKWGLFDGEDMVAVGYFVTRQFLPQDVMAYDFEPSSFPALPAGPDELLAHAGAPDPRLLRQVSAIALCSVARAEAETAVLVHLHSLGLPAHPLWRIQASERSLGVRNGYAQPQRLGADRWAALIAARHLVAGTLVVVMAGTATTVDALTADGDFLGGYILPGLRLMPKSLYERTAGIRPSDGHWQPFPKATSDAVTSGVLAASAGAVAGMVQRLNQQQPPLVLLSGGNGPALAERLQELGLTWRYARDLVLHGIARLYRARNDIL